MTTFVQLGLDGQERRVLTCAHCSFSTPDIVELSLHLRNEHLVKNSLGNPHLPAPPRHRPT